MHPGGVLWISSDSDDWIIGAKIKNPKKSLCLPAKPQKIPMPSSKTLKNPYAFQQNPKKSLCLPAKPQKILGPEINPVTSQNVILTQKVINMLMQNVIKILMQNVIIFQLIM